ncbi:IniB N-terminal domain-containing protein [Saccharopolyspora sp. NPDC002376]
MASPQHATDRAESSTPDPGTHSAGLPDQPTLYEFLTRLVSDPASRSAFDADPQATLDQAGLGAMSATDVLHATSLVLDYAPVEVVTEYGRSLQSSVEKFAASSQAVAFNELHPAHPLDQEEQSMLQNTPQPADFGKDNDVDANLPEPQAPANNTDVDVDIEQNDSHNLISIHHVLSDNNISIGNGNGNIVGNTVGQVGDSLDLGEVAGVAGDVVYGSVTEINGTANHVFDTTVDLTAAAGSTVYGDVTNMVSNVSTGDVTNIAGDLNVVNILGDVTNVAGDLNGGNVTEIVANAPVVGDVVGQVGEIATNAPVVGDVVTNVGDTVTNAPVVGDIANTALTGDITDVTGVVGGVAGNVTSIAGDVPVVGDAVGVVGGVASNVPVVGDAVGAVAGSGDVSALPIDDATSVLPVDDVTSALPLDDVTSVLPVDDVTSAVPAAPLETVTDTVSSLPVAGDLVGGVADTATSALPLDHGLL